MSNELAILNFNGHQIGRDAEGRVSLTDLWKSAGAQYKKDPGTWKAQKQNKGFITHISNTPNLGGLKVLDTKRGNGGGTYAHPQIALAYAKSLSHKLHAFVNEVFFDRAKEEANPELIIDRAIKTFRRKGLSDAQISARIQGQQARNLLTTTASTHGVRGEGFRDITNAVYMPILGGTAAQVRRRDSLPAKANIRDSRSVLELRAIEFAELLACENIEQKNVFGNEACVNECYRAGAEVKAAVMRSRGHQQRVSS